MTTETTQAPAQATETTTATSALRTTFKNFVDTQEIKGNFQITRKTLKTKFFPFSLSKTLLANDPSDGNNEQTTTTHYSLNITKYFSISVGNPKSKPTTPPTVPVTIAASGRSPAAE